MIGVVGKRSVFLLSVLLLTFVGTAYGMEGGDVCKNPLADKDVVKIFKQNALNQLALEFGRDGSFVYDIEQFPVDDVLVGLEAYARYPKPGQKDLARMRLKAWVSRCNGTTIIRGNTWLADGTLKVLRYSEEQMKGRGLLWGKKDAPLRFIVYLDSRCPHCHRLIDYARKLVEQGKVLLDLRQVAYLEKREEAIMDTRLSHSSLVVKENPSVDDAEYLDLLGGNNSTEELATDTREYRDAHKLITENTTTAEKVLHIITVPGVLVQEKEHNNQYRKMGYWEINRIFQ